MRHSMRPIRDAAGNARGDLDHREVPVSIMAEYLGIEASTLYRRWIAGKYPREGGRLIDSITWFRPRIMLGLQDPKADGRTHV